MKSPNDMENKVMIDRITEGRLIIEAILQDSAPTQPGDLIHNLMKLVRFDLPLPETVKLHPCLPFYLGDEAFGAYPAMVLPLRDGQGNHAGIKTVYLGPTGYAQVVTPVQVILVDEDRPGVFFQLDEHMTPSVGVAVGLGPALAARTLLSLEMSLCAVRTHADLAAFDWPVGTKALTVLCDDASTTHAEALMDRAHQAGIEVQAIKPPTGGGSWLDEYLFRNAVPADEIAAAKQSSSTTH